MHSALARAARRAHIYRVGTSAIAFPLQGVRVPFDILIIILLILAVGAGSMGIKDMANHGNPGGCLMIIVIGLILLFAAFSGGR